jgi:2-keto-4-pentenoate hydratase/2-oxohepta-3-ene-1,7-dioic acid hydratase in catechol pathway
MRHLIFGFAAAATFAGALATAQAPQTPFKLGTFERQGRPFVGIVLRDSVVVDFAAAHAAIRTPASTIAAPTDMKDLIARYDTGVRGRIVEIVRAVETAGAARPAYVFERTALKTLPPIMYPTTMLNVAVNYREHDLEMAVMRNADPALKGTFNAKPTLGAAPEGTQSAPGYWTRASSDNRWNPYMFMKAPAAVVADGDSIRLPPQRTRVDWECEMGVVIGRQASRVSVADAASHIFGYTIENDVSDRGGRGDARYGSDWVIAKNHDTFAPMGPWITPKEFIVDPQNLRVTFTLNGQLLQDGNTSLMIHNVFEQVSYASNIITLRVGDVIATGTPAGVGSARMPPIFYKPGDTGTCMYEGIGTLTNAVVGS